MDTNSSKIDIYVDGSWLNAGKHNPVAAGGWGAVIVQQNSSGTNIRYLGGLAPQDMSSSNEVEELAVICALNDVKNEEYQHNTSPVIIIHTDRDVIINYLSALEKGEPTSEKKSSQLIDIGVLAQEMGASVAEAREPKTESSSRQNESPFMTTAHQLAAKMAQKARLESQGYIYIHSTGKLEGHEAMKAIAPNPLLSVKHIIVPSERRHPQ